MSNVIVSILAPAGVIFLAGLLTYFAQRLSKGQAQIQEHVKEVKNTGSQELMLKIAEINTKLGFLHAEKEESHRELFGQVTRVSSQLSAHIEQDRQGFHDVDRQISLLSAEIATARERLTGLEARADRMEDQ